MPSLKVNLGPPKQSLTEIDNALRAPNGWDEAKAKMPQAVFKSPFDLGDKVIIDGHADLITIVTAVAWRDTNGCSIEVSWVHNGSLHNEWMHPRRLKLA